MVCRRPSQLLAALKFSAILACWAAIASGTVYAQALPRGEIIDDVPCQRDAAESYALYLPSSFDASRRWPVIVAFDGGGHGREGVEAYRAAAEKYGYVVAGSNNSRNGPWEVGLAAAAAVIADVQERFPIDVKREYTAGLSGGARVAIMVAQTSPDIAGVLASSAGYSTAFHRSERFPLFGSAGTEDFNYREMRTVDKAMTSAHRVEVFEGGHTWLPSEMATRGVEWMEVQAMKRGLKSRDEALIDALFATRLAHANAQANGLTRMREFDQIAGDFGGLHDVATVIEAGGALKGRQDVADAVRTEEADDARELRVASKIDLLVRRLAWPEAADAALVELKSFAAALLDVARTAENSSDRRIARRALAGLRASRRGVPNQMFQEWIDTVDLAPAH